LYEEGVGASVRLAQFDESQGVGGVWGSDDEHGIDLRSDGDDGLLSVGGGVADVAGLRSLDVRES
jgi:hypothetical protein